MVSQPIFQVRQGYGPCMVSHRYRDHIGMTVAVEFADLDACGEITGRRIIHDWLECAIPIA